MQQIEINREPIELFKILKFEGLVDSGAQAKQVIAEGLVPAKGARCIMAINLALLGKILLCN